MYADLAPLTRTILLRAISLRAISLTTRAKCHGDLEIDVVFSLVWCKNGSTSDSTTTESPIVCIAGAYIS